MIDWIKYDLIPIVEKGLYAAASIGLVYVCILLISNRLTF